MTVIHSDCLDAMRAMPDASVDSIVSDPPYGLAFMGKAWDHGVPGVPFWAEALRVAKPGAYLVAFGGTRTYHRLACAIEDAGWEIRDCLSWLYGSGFPKSMNVSKALEAHETLGGSHTVMMRKAAMGDDYTESEAKGTFRNGAEGAMNSVRTTPPEFNPTTDLARQWQGWGTALKPAWEPIILARKPLVGTVAANVAAHGTGALNVDGCRIEALGGITRGGANTGRRFADGGSGFSEHERTPEHPSGRWPANVCLDEHSAALLDAQSGERKGMAGGGKHRADYAGGMFGAIDAAHLARGDSGGASRFFYTAKASRREREAGLEGMPERFASVGNLEAAGRDAENPANYYGGQRERVEAGLPASEPRTNHHPTVKPIALMRWLVRLVTPPNGLVLDPFTGSGTTGCAAVLEGFRFLGCEREAEYVAIAEKRIAHWAVQKAPEPEPSLF